MEPNRVVVHLGHLGGQMSIFQTVAFVSTATKLNTTLSMATPSSYMMLLMVKVYSARRAMTQSFNLGDNESCSINCKWTCVAACDPRVAAGVPE
jgi:hypothetical protein